MTTDESFTVQTARDAESAGALAQWITDFLASDGSDNAELGRELRDGYPIWFGPVRVRFDLLRRLAGPPDQPTLERLDSDDEDTVEGMEESIEEGWTPPPFVATWQGDHIRLEDGNHRVEGLRRAGEDAYWCVIGAEAEEQRTQALAAIRS